MAIGHVVTRGYGNGTLVGDVNVVVVRGYSVGVVLVPDSEGVLYTATGLLVHYTAPGQRLQ